MNLLNLLHKLKISETKLRQMICTTEFKISDIDVLLSKCIQEEYFITDEQEIKIIKQIINDYFYYDTHTSTLASDHKIIFEDLCNVIYEEGLSNFFQLKIDFGNMLNISKYLSKNKMEETFTIEQNVINYQNFILQLFENSLIKISNKYGFLIIRDDIDEFSILISTSSFIEMKIELDNIMRKIQLFAEKTELCNLPHSKTGKKGGIYIRLDIYELLGENVKRKINYQWERYHIYKNEQIDSSGIRKRVCKEFSKIKLSKEMGNEEPNIDSLTFFKANHSLVLADLINPEIMRERHLVFYLNSQGINNSLYILNIYKSLHNISSPFEVILNSIAYSKDMRIYKKILSMREFAVLHITIKWQNWSGVITEFGEDSVHIVNNWIQKNFVEQIYHDKIISSNSRIYNDSGRLIIIQFAPIITKRGAEDYINQKILDIENYINQMPGRYIVNNYHGSTTFGEIMDPRNSQNIGIKIKYKINNYQDIRNNNFDFPVTKMSNNKKKNYSLYG